MLDTSPPRLDGLQIDGTLRFRDEDLTLSSDRIMVHGRLQIGSEQTPFGSRARMVLTGIDRTQNVMNMGAKVLGVHGQERHGWTRLAANAAAGSRRITLDNAAGWRRGDRIVVSSTDYDPQ